MLLAILFLYFYLLIDVFFVVFWRLDGLVFSGSMPPLSLLF